MNEFELNNFEYHRRCLVKIARELGVVKDVDDPVDGFRPALVSVAGLDLSDTNLVTAGDVTWDILAAIDELKMLVQHADCVLSKYGTEDAALRDYLERLRDFPPRANPDRRDL